MKCTYKKITKLLGIAFGTIITLGAMNGVYAIDTPVIEQGANGNVAIEGESVISYADDSVKSFLKTYNKTELSGGSTLYVENSSNDGWSLELEYKFNVTKAGEFKLYTSICNKWISTWFSPIDIKIDNGEYETINDSLYQWSADILANPTIKKVVRKENVKLSEGEHTITLRVNTKRSAGGYYAYVDSLNLEYRDSLEVPTVEQDSDGNAVIEGESIIPYACDDIKSSLKTYSKDALSGGSTLYIENASTDSWNCELKYKVNITKAGEFKVYPTVGNQFLAAWFGPCDIKIDNGDYEAINGDYYQWSADVLSNPMIKKLVKKNEVTLSEGEHTITLRVNTQRTGGGYYVYFDCLKLERQPEVTSKYDVTVKFNGEDDAVNGLNIATINVANNTANDFEAMGVVAVYDLQGSLKQIANISIKTIKSNNSGEISFDDYFELEATETVKVFVWEKSTLTPAMNAVVQKIN